MLQDMNFINNYKIDCPTLARYVPGTALGAGPLSPAQIASVLRPLPQAFLGGIFYFFIYLYFLVFI